MAKEDTCSSFEVSSWSFLFFLSLLSWGVSLAAWFLASCSAFRLWTCPITRASTFEGSTTAWSPSTCRYDSDGLKKITKNQEARASAKKKKSEANMNKQQKIKIQDPRSKHFMRQGRKSRNMRRTDTGISVCRRSHQISTATFVSADSAYTTVPIHAKNALQWQDRRKWW